MTGTTGLEGWYNRFGGMIQSGSSRILGVGTVGLKGQEKAYLGGGLTNKEREVLACVKAVI
jgi:hypothetical protein